VDAVDDKPATAPEPKKCHFVPKEIPGRKQPAQELVPCKTLESRADSGFESKRKGLRFLDNMIHFESGIDWNFGAAYFRTATDKGLLLNYCPWCGEKILNPEGYK
jgi:hypothetical protein